MHCKYCGMEHPNNARFCPVTGKTLNDSKNPLQWIPLLILVFIILGISGWLLTKTNYLNNLIFSLQSKRLESTIASNSTQLALLNTNEASNFTPLSTSISNPSQSKQYPTTGNDAGVNQFTTNPTVQQLATTPGSQNAEPTPSPMSTSGTYSPSFTTTENMFCRNGPGQIYEAHTTILKGEKLPVLAKWFNNDWLLVGINKSSTRTKCCWIGGEGSLNLSRSSIPSIDYLPDRIECVITVK